ncbi:MAG: ABC transporter family substrate-binding protein [Actinomycetota bacterium]|nr:ABC transporter family substrate-binding protein [Actinomycetota bacterium]
MSLLTAGALALSACSQEQGGESAPEPGENVADDPAGDEGDAGDEGGEGGTAPGTISVAVSAEMTAYNSNTATQNATWNTYVENGTRASFWSYAADATIDRNEDFGTYEKTSDAPLTVEYEINDGVEWSDGEPIDCDDILLEWASSSGKLVDAKDKNIFNPASTTGMEDVIKPNCEPGDKAFTAEYAQPYVDWELTFSGGSIPAHVAAKEGGLTPEELVTAIQEDDIEALTPVAKFWNTGWDMNPGELLDDALIPSSGPYLLDNWDGGQSVTLKANPDFWGTPARTETIVLRLLDDAQQLQALQNGEVDVVNPGNPTIDTIESLEQLEGQVDTIIGENLTWSHVDMQQGEGRVFEQLEVRQAFAKCIPRDLIVQNLNVPVNPESVVLDLREFFPIDESYEEVRTEAFPEDMYGETDVEGAAQLIADAGVETPIPVRFMFASDNPVRSDIAALIKSECDKAGFDIQPMPDVDWGSKLAGAPGDYDAVLFAWAGSGVIGSGAALYQTGAGQNFYEYTNPQVDELWDEVLTQVDKEASTDLRAQIETLLWEDVFSIPLFVNNNVTAVSTQIEGVVSNASQTGVTFNMDEWARTG